MEPRHMVKYEHLMILEARESLDSSSKVLGGKGCHGVGSKLWPATVLIRDATPSNCSTKSQAELRGDDTKL